MQRDRRNDERGSEAFAGSEHRWCSLTPLKCSLMNHAQTVGQWRWTCGRRQTGALKSLIWLLLVGGFLQDCVPMSHFRKQKYSYNVLHQWREKLKQALRLTHYRAFVKHTRMPSACALWCNSTGRGGDFCSGRLCWLLFPELPRLFTLSVWAMFEKAASSVRPPRLRPPVSHGSFHLFMLPL